MRLTYPLKCKDNKHLPLNLRLEKPLSEYYKIITYIKNIIYPHSLHTCRNLGEGKKCIHKHLRGDYYYVSFCKGNLS